MPITVAAGALSGLWLFAAGWTARSEAATRLIAEYPAFRPAGQAAFLALKRDWPTVKQQLGLK